jgi:chromosome segregation ATPase
MNQRYEYLQRFIEADKTLVIPTADPRLIRLQVSAANGIEQKRNLLRSLEAEFRNQFQGTYREIEQLEHQVSAFRSTTDARLDHIDQTARQQIAAIGRQQERLQTEIDSLHSRNRELDGRIAKVKTGVDSIEQEQAKIEVAINETRAAIKERKKEGLGQLVTVIACVGVGVFTAHQLGIAIIPSANGAGVSLFAPL